MYYFEFAVDLEKQGIFAPHSSWELLLKSKELSSNKNEMGENSPPRPISFTNEPISCPVDFLVFVFLIQPLKWSPIQMSTFSLCSRRPYSGLYPVIPLLTKQDRPPHTNPTLLDDVPGTQDSRIPYPNSLSLFLWPDDTALSWESPHKTGTIRIISLQMHSYFLGEIYFKNHPFSLS